MDFVRNEHFNLRFKVTNVGKLLFPGGTIQKIVMRETQPVGVFLESRDKLELEPISPGQSRITKPMGLSSLTWEGTVMVTLVVKSRGRRAKIRYYQQRGVAP